MKSSLATALSVGFLLLASSASAAKVNYKASLSGKGVAGTGSAALTYDDVTKKLCGKVTYTGLSGTPTVAHVHHITDAFGPKPIPITASPLVVEITFNDADYAKVVAAETYVNIHTAAKANGEIAGDIVPDPTGAVQTCASEAPVDAGTDASSSSSSSSSTSSSSSSSGGSSSGTTSGSSTSSTSSGSNGATTTRADAGDTSDTSADDGGCAAGGSGATSTGLSIAAGVGIALALASRGRRRARR